MRHPPRSGLLLVAAPVALVGTAVAPVVTASGAVPACTVEYSVTSQWDAGFQGAVKITNNQAALSGWSLTFDFTGGQKVTQAWTCWRDGGTCPGIGYEVAGMQDLVDAVRATGAKNVILAGGLAYSNDLSQWLTYRPNDPTGNLAAAWHVYNFNTCSNEGCWNSTLAPVADRVPLVAGEIGENTCAHSFIDRVMAWFDARRLSCLGWTWNTWNCGSGPALIAGYDGTPTSFGIGLRDHLRSLDG